MIFLRLRDAAAVLATIIAIGSPMAIASAAWAGAPTDALRSHINNIFALLDDPALKGAEQTAARLVVGTGDVCADAPIVDAVDQDRLEGVAPSPTEGIGAPAG